MSRSNSRAASLAAIGAIAVGVESIRFAYQLERRARVENAGTEHEVFL